VAGRLVCPFAPLEGKNGTHAGGQRDRVYITGNRLPFDGPAHLGAVPWSAMMECG
jgi:hypothetical protein